MSHLSPSAKDRIKLAFSRASLGYDRFASLQKEVADDLLNGIILPPTTHHPPPTNVLDIGCGTGFLTYGLADAFPDAHISGCDISHSMIELARDKNNSDQHKKIHLLTADGETLPYRDEVFHIVASNLTYQWVTDLKTAFLEAHRVLRPGGLFAFSTLGQWTLKELKGCYKEVVEGFNKDGLPPFIDFLGEEAIILSIKMAGFDHISIERINNIQSYPDMWVLLKTLKSIGAGNPYIEGDKSLARGSLLKEMAEVYKDRFKIQDSRLKTCNLHLATCGCIYATYEVLFVKAIKL